MKNIDIWLTNFLLSIGLWGYVLSCFLILIESMVPILPLFVFITLLFYKFGYVVGFILSYIFTVLGCYISYLLFGKFKNKLANYLSKKDAIKLQKVMKRIKNIKLENLCVIIAIPFTPAFLVNIAAGLVGISKRKYIISILIGKVFLVIFWGFIGTSLLESLKNPKKFIIILIMLILCFAISKIINKKEGIE